MNKVEVEDEVGASKDKVILILDIGLVCVRSAVA